jgi:argininosuccinate lyase
MKQETATNEGTLWGGRFEKEPSDHLAALSKSTQFDWVLAQYDVKGSLAHANALFKAKILTHKEFDTLKSALDLMLEDIENGVLLPDVNDEDVHGALERILIDRVGAEIGGKLRAGRSRNDQIASLIRMYLFEQEQCLRSLVIDTIRSIVEQAKLALRDEVIMPGRTHLQHAQPVLLAHHLLAHAWPLLRDLKRFQDWKQRATLSPYGSGALAGQTLGLDAMLIAKELGFSGLENNSIDAVSSRDVAAEFLFILTLIGINLSRFAEEIILWNTKEFDFVKLDDAFSTGSSIMPQKKNPDIAELTRGKSGRLIGDLTGLLATLKAMPLAYNRDLQEDKEPIFDAVDQLKVVLPAFSGMILSAKFNYTKMQELAPRGFALATDIAEWLVKQGVPFRTSHELSGSCVKLCEKRAQETGTEVELWDLSADDYEQLLGAELEKVTANASAGEVKEILTAQASVNARGGFSGTAIESVQQQLITLVKSVNDLR